MREIFPRVVGVRLCRRVVERRSVKLTSSRTFRAQPQLRLLSAQPEFTCSQLSGFRVPTVLPALHIGIIEGQTCFRT